jgi:hypothetical protein
VDKLILESAAAAVLAEPWLGALLIAAPLGSQGRSAADQPSMIMDALRTNRESGISTEAVFVAGGVSQLMITWMLAMLVGPHQRL